MPTYLFVQVILSDFDVLWWVLGVYPRVVVYPSLGALGGPWAGLAPCPNLSPILCSKTEFGPWQPPETLRAKTLGYFCIPPDPLLIPPDNFWVGPNPGPGQAQNLIFGVPNNLQLHPLGWLGIF